MHIVSPPWSLNGIGFVHLFWGSKRIDPFSGKTVSGLGACIIARYDESPVGPYNELLYIPGRQKLHGKNAFFISKIYVDSEASMVSGQANWGIPKEIAKISIKSTYSTQYLVEASHEGQLFFQSNFEHYGLRFPVTTQLIPIPLLQLWKDEVFKTKFTGKGTAQLSHSKFDIIDKACFADINSFQSLVTLAVSPFMLTFPKPSMINPKL